MMPMDTLRSIGEQVRSCCGDTLWFTVIQMSEVFAEVTRRPRYLSRRYATSRQLIRISGPAHDSVRTSRLALGHSGGHDIH